MAFHFQAFGDPLLTRIHLRDIETTAKQWHHPMKGMFKYAESMREHGGDILKLSKKDRERYCISLVALALQKDSNLDWWINMPNRDTPDGLVMTLSEESEGSYRGQLLEIEVVEHRDTPGTLLETIKRKMTEKAYGANTSLVCLVLSSAIYDLELLSKQVAQIDSPLKQIFIVFAGVPLSSDTPTDEQLRTTFTMVQLRPTFEKSSFDYRPYIEDFKRRYDMGQESRLIEGSKMYFGTTNPKFVQAEMGSASVLTKE